MIPKIAHDITLVQFVNFLTVLILSTSLHEMAHAWTATKFGDPTPERAGRLTFNPFKHLNIFWSIVLPSLLYLTAGTFLAGAWTPVTPALMRRPRLHGTLTALAGPATNFLLATLALAVWIGLAASQDGFSTTDRWQAVAALAVGMNIVLGIFNLLPLPPLDGGHLLEVLAPRALAPAVEWLHRHSMTIFIVLLVTGALGAATRPVQRVAFEGVRAVIDVAEDRIRGR